MSEPDSEIIERVARAMYGTHAYRPPGGAGNPSPTWDNASDNVREWVRKQAAAAIAAMSEPTEG